MRLLQAELPYLNTLVVTFLLLSLFHLYVESYPCSVSHCEELHFSYFERQSSPDSRQVFSLCFSVVGNFRILEYVPYSAKVFLVQVLFFARDV